MWALRVRSTRRCRRSRRSIATVELDDREPCLILRPVTDGDSQWDPSVAIWSALRNTDLLAAAIGKPVEIVGPDR